MTSFVLSFFPLDVLDEIWDIVESFLRDFLPTFTNFMISMKPVFWTLRNYVTNSRI